MADTVTAFDPENVERLYSGEFEPEGQIVRASDYDKLLATYREAENKLRCIYGDGPLLPQR